MRRIWRPVTISALTLPGADLLVRVAIGGRISLMVGIAAALVAVIVGTLYGSVVRLSGGKIDSVMMRLLVILNSFLRLMFFVILLVIALGRTFVDFRRHRHGLPGLIWRVSCVAKP